MAIFHQHTHIGGHSSAVDQVTEVNLAEDIEMAASVPSIGPNSSCPAQIDTNMANDVINGAGDTTGNTTDNIVDNTTVDVVTSTTAVNEIDHTNGDQVNGQGRTKHVSHNIQGIFLHLLGDLLGSIGVIISGLLIWLTDLDVKYKRLFDPCFSIIIILIISVPAIRLAFITARILLQRVPSSINIGVIRDAINQLSKKLII